MTKAGSMIARLRTALQPLLIVTAASTAASASSDPDLLRLVKECTPPGTNAFRSAAEIKAEVDCISAAIRPRQASSGTSESPVLWLLATRGKLELRYGLDGALQSGPACVAQNELVLPQGPPIKINLTAEDAIYEVLAPEIDVKADAMPGRITSLTATVGRTGRFQGRIVPDGRKIEHTFAIRVLTPPEYVAWERRTLRSRGCGRR
jgi:hypothetical protein